MKTYADAIVLGITSGNYAKPWKRWWRIGHHRQGKTAQNKFVCGPGGIMCACCTRVHPSLIKVFVNRRERRRLRQQINNMQIEE